MTTMQSYSKKNTEEQLNTSVKMMLNIYNNTMQRYKNTKDPSIKFTLLVDKLCFMIDIALAALTTFAVEEKNLSPELQVDLDTVSKDLQIELGKLTDWIQSPIYGPDHPYGKHLMQESQKSFETNTVANDKK